MRALPAYCVIYSKLKFAGYRRHLFFINPAQGFQQQVSVGESLNRDRKGFQGQREIKDPLRYLQQLAKSLLAFFARRFSPHDVAVIEENTARQQSFG